MKPTDPRKNKGSSASSATRAIAADAGGRSSPLRSEGQRMLQAVPDSLSQIAKACGAGKSTVGDWRTGAKEPGQEYRAALERVYGISSLSWAQVPGGEQERAPRVPRPPATPADAEESDGRPTNLADCLALIDAMRGAAREPDINPADRIKLVDSLSRLMTLRHRLEKEAELVEDRIVRQHPLWARLKAAVLSALVPFPDAARAVADKLEGLEAE